MFFNLLHDQDVEATRRFPDELEGAWHERAVLALAALGIIQGHPDGLFHPEDSITRAEFVAIAARFAEGLPAITDDTPFSDVPDYHWAYRYIHAAVQFEWVLGYGDGTFQPNRNLSRAEAVTIVNRMLGRVADRHFVDEHMDLERFDDVAQTHWAFYDIMEAFDAHKFERDEDDEEHWRIHNSQCTILVCWAGGIMGWFHEWWLSLGLLGQIMACAAIPMTIVMFMQLLLMIFGSGFGGASDSDLDNDGIDPGADSSANEAGSYGNYSFFRIITVRGIVAFFALGGWAGLAALTAGIPAIWSIQISLVSGAAAMLLASLVIKLALRMQDSGNLNVRNALSQTAEVYIAIPPSRSNFGKVTMLLQERFVELEAVTDSPEILKPNTKVEVIGVTEDDRLVVRPLEDQIEAE
jgi:hypothetical protein